MELLYIRKHFTAETTIGELFADGAFECYCLEDVDRGLHSEMTLDKIKEIKVHGKTAIPTGRYEVIMSFSNRFKKYLPQLLNVPGFEGIRIHPGNKHEDTEGCLLPGTEFYTDQVTLSRKAFTALYAKLKAVEKKEKIYITVKSMKAL